MSPKNFRKIPHSEQEISLGVEISLYLSNSSKEVSTLTDWQTYKTSSAQLRSAQRSPGYWFDQIGLAQFSLGELDFFGFWFGFGSGSVQFWFWFSWICVVLSAAKNIHVLEVLIWGLEGHWRFPTKFWHLALDLDIFTGLWYTHVLDFSSLSWF